MSTMNPDISLSSEIPDSEPERQYYYIEKARRHVADKGVGKAPYFLRDDLRLPDECPGL